MKNRYIRQSELVPLVLLKNKSLLIVGTGAIGRQVALQAAAMGIPRIELVDFDTVEDVNLASQGFRERDLGQPKVNAVANACREINSQIEITTHNRAFDTDLIPVNGIIMCCVDSITTRGIIFTKARKSIWAWIDGRMTAEVMRIVTAYDDETKLYYRRTLFAKEEATPGRCTAKSTIYCANIAAGLMITQLTKLLRGAPVEKDMILNLFLSMMEYDIDEETKKAA